MHDHAYLWNLDNWRDDRKASEWIDTYEGTRYVCDAELANKAYEQGYDFGLRDVSFGVNPWNHPSTRAAFNLGFDDGEGDRLANP